MEKLLFREEQRFTQWWLWFLIIAATLAAIIPFIIGIYWQEVLGKPWGNNPADTGLLVGILCFNILLMGTILFVFIRMHLIIEIKSDGIWYRFPPLARKWAVIKKEEIERFEIRAYRPITEYGGWGIKGNAKNRAYHVQGDTGLQLFLKNGKKVLFGTQKKQAINYAMEILMKSEREE
jgi:hypothetical protein